MAITVSTLGKVNPFDSGKGMRYIKQTLSMYSKLHDRLHFAACVAIHHAAEYGNADVLTTLHAGLKRNDQTALRVWLGSKTAYDIEGEDKVVTTENWIDFSSDSFHVKKGTETFRKGLERYFPETLLNGSKFADRSAKEPDPFDTEAAEKAFENAYRRLERGIKLNDENGFEGWEAIPLSVQTKYEELIAAVKAA